MIGRTSSRVGRDPKRRSAGRGDHEGHVVWLRVAATADVLFGGLASSDALPN